MEILYYFFFFKQKTAYEMRISDWSSDVCSSDLRRNPSASLKRYAAETDSCLFTRPRSIRPVAGFTHGLLPHIILGDWRDLDFHASVLRFAFFGRIAGDGLSLAQAPGGNPRRLPPIDRKSVAEGKCVSLRVDLGGHRFIKKKMNRTQ